MYITWSLKVGISLQIRFEFVILLNSLKKPNIKKMEKNLIVVDSICVLACFTFE